MQRNISIAYLLAFFRHAFLWLGIWVFYYLRFTNYAGIGIVETSMLVAMTLSEIPTGAIADLLGKRKTLQIAFFLMTVGMLIISFANGISGLILGVVLAGIGGAFYSGTLEALVYDSLKQEGKQSMYEKKIANINTISMFSPAVLSVLGGFLYTMRPNLPFIFHAILYLFAFLSCFFLTEPSIDSEKFSFRNFLLQTKYGIRYLFGGYNLKRQTILLLAIGSVIVIADEMLNGFLGVEFGFTPSEMGVLWAGISLVAAGASQLTPYFKKYATNTLLILMIGVSIGISLLISPYIGLLFGGVSLFVRESFQVMYTNISSVMINETTDSKYRATTLSTFNLIKNIPYVFSAYYLGGLADHYTSVNVANWLGYILIIFLIIFVIEKLFSKKYFSF